ncbi:MAG: multicopper oxidase domain-containing protein, partial [Rhodothermales bacterium]
MRGRRVIYSGWGGGSFPQGTSNRKNEVAAFYRIPQKVTSGGVLGGVSGPETMMIDCRKFNDDPENLEDIGHHMLLETAEEWTVSNFTMTLFGNDQTGALPPTPTKPDPRTHLGNKPYPSSQQKTNITTKAVDHPFHIHINPCWVVGIYDWEGKRLNWNYERYDGVAGKESFYPRWHDVIRLPRNGGWVVFRSRFWDFDGQYVNHCHILQHEDNGMMQGIAVVPDASQADYVPFDRGTNYRPSGTNPVFRKPTWEECYEMDWGLGDTKTVTGEEQRTQCIALRTRLRTPQP